MVNPWACRSRRALPPLPCQPGSLTPTGGGRAIMKGTPRLISGALRAPRRAAYAPTQIARTPRLQDLRLEDPLRVCRRHYDYRRPQRQREIQHCGCDSLGAGRAIVRPAARQANRGHDLRRFRAAAARRDGLGHDHVRQWRRRTADRLHRGGHCAPRVPRRRQRIPAQRPACAPEGYRGAASPNRPGGAYLYRHRPGSGRRSSGPQTRGAAALVRGGGGHRSVSRTPRRRLTPAGSHPAQLGACAGYSRRTAAEGALT